MKRRRKKRENVMKYLLQYAATQTVLKFQKPGKFSDQLIPLLVVTLHC